MREPLFIKKNKDKWESYDYEHTNDPNILSERFTNILDDLAYAQTFYPKGKTVQYLNERAVNFYNQIYKRKKEPISKLFDFWKIDLPIMIRRNHRFILMALILFLFAVLLGSISAIYDDRFLLSVLGQDYIDMTKDNIAKGNPFGRYGDNSSTATFFHIAFNNISLAFLYDFIGGIFLCIATIYSVFTNGMMVGGFHYLFYQANLGWEFGLVVFIHGTFELFALVLSAAAGFRLFNSIIFKETYTRIESIKRGFSDGMQLMILVFILLFFAAFLESFITRLTAASVANHPTNLYIPLWVSILILLFCVTLIIWYFLVIPIIVSKKIKKEIAKTSAENNLGKVIFKSNE